MVCAPARSGLLAWRDSLTPLSINFFSFYFGLFVPFLFFFLQELSEKFPPKLLLSLCDYISLNCRFRQPDSGFCENFFCSRWGFPKTFSHFFQDFFTFFFANFYVRIFPPLNRCLEIFPSLFSHRTLIFPLQARFSKLISSSHCAEVQFLVFEHLQTGILQTNWWVCGLWSFRIEQVLLLVCFTLFCIVILPSSEALQIWENL